MTDSQGQPGLFWFSIYTRTNQVMTSYQQQHVIISRWFRKHENLQIIINKKIYKLYGLYFGQNLSTTLANTWYLIRLQNIIGNSKAGTFAFRV